MGDYHWAVGVILAAFASIVSNLGLNFQKLCHLRNADAPEDVKHDYYKNTLWVSGLVMIIVGSVADFAALAFGAQSIIAPLGSLTLVSNVFVAPCLLGETVTPRDIFSTFLIIAGCTLAVVFASHKDTIYGLETLFGFYEQPRFGLYAMFMLVMMGVLWSAIQYMEALRKEDAGSHHYLKVVRYHRFCYAAIAGTVGAQSVLFAKCSSELLVNTIIGQGFLLSYYQTWMVLICMGTTIFLQIKWLNQGLQRFDALYIVPVFQSFWILISVLSGLIFFGEYEEMNSAQVVMFPIGVVLTIAGVFFLSQRGVEEAEISSENRRPSTPPVSASAQAQAYPAPIAVKHDADGSGAIGNPANFGSVSVARAPSPSPEHQELDGDGGGKLDPDDGAAGADDEAFLRRFREATTAAAAAGGDGAGTTNGSTSSTPHSGGDGDGAAVDKLAAAAVSGPVVAQQSLTPGGGGGQESNALLAEEAGQRERRNSAPGPGATSGGKGAPASQHHQHHHHNPVIDESVGFMGVTAPAGWLPSSAMRLSNSLRVGKDSEDEHHYDGFEDEDGL